MRFTVNREALLKPLQLVTGVVERRHTIPILSNVMLTVREGRLLITGTDSDLELVSEIELSSTEEVGATTVSARKLMDICKSLPDDSFIQFNTDNKKLKLSSDRSKFTLAVLPAEDFPSIKEEEGALSFSVEKTKFRSLIDSTSFSMANQDVRIYLNGMLLEVRANELIAVTTDGHRLAMSAIDGDINQLEAYQVLVPRKAILEMARLLAEGDGIAHITVTKSYIRAQIGDFIFTSRLIDGKFPDYERVLPRGGDKVVIGSRNLLRQAFGRAAILSNEKFRGVRVLLEKDGMKIIASNPEQEEAEDFVSLSYQGPSIEIVFNVNYILDVLSVISSKEVKITLSDPSSSALIEEVDSGDSVYVIMPMHL